MTARLLRRTGTGLLAMLLMVAATPCSGQGSLGKVSAEMAARIAEAFAPELRPEPPDWAQIDREPLFTFAWASDFHLDGSRLGFIARALRYIDTELRPDFLVITGDNNAHPAPPTDPHNPEPVSLRRQKFFKAYLAKHLKTPYAVIPGDNWPHDFHRVFGPTQYSFDFGGLHFLFTAVDQSFHGAGSEGLAVFNDATWAWMRGDLEKNREKPTILLQHEPIFPPTFLDAKRLQQMLDKHPNVIAGFHGHLHADMAIEGNGQTYVVCPALGPGSPPAMKQVRVYPHVLILQTIEFNKPKRRFEMVNKWQKIDVPQEFSSRLARPQGKHFVMENYDAVPPHAHRKAPELAGHLGELLGIFRGFLLRDLYPAMERRGGLPTPLPRAAER